ncbi:TetR/AcrR family transcriptional regulator [Rhodovastum atsumiense]|uniref:TetR/AcrR family transcriptional regulator n=1 Tax=Rhodovastum atsumiense TaxID=504468 RepID=A0A5M6IM25_9PROT|nr:TetR/AcrR family transcriptional regulator C-terminal domain-containing protein [Rhodovastum atsumiense]KAA5609343.1 TetR/AcrR family transcriptional regulator [Rhodovastum atsumiense]CAH2602355.1 TetR/AcrR family transcriptional regulator [Rhodovastum atsumiense]
MSRQAARSDAKREAIIAAATCTFLAEGYAAAAMDDIAARAQVSKRTIYNHFPAKRDLFQAVVARLYASLLAPDAGMLTDAAPPARALPAFAAHVLAHLRQPDLQALLRLVIAEHHRFPELAQDFFAGGKGRAQALLQGYLAAQAARGRLAIADPARAACEFLGAIKEGCYWPALLGVPTAPDDTAIASATAAFLRAYAPRR